MANRYWVGDSGTWNDSSTTHWSASSGGAGGASVPTSSDNVIFDANSFSGSGKTVTLGNFLLNCLDFDASGVTNSPTFATDGSGASAMQIYGSFTLVSGLTWTATDLLMRFYAASIGNTVTFAGHTMGRIDFNGEGAWTTTDDLTINATIYQSDLFIVNGDVIFGGNIMIGRQFLMLTYGRVTLNGNLTLGDEFYQENGIFDSNGYNITCSDFYFFADYDCNPVFWMNGGTFIPSRSSWTLDENNGVKVIIDTWVRTDKPSNSTYTYVSKPGGITYLGVGRTIGLLIPLTISTVLPIGNPYTNVGKPTGSSYTTIAKPT